MNLDQKFQTAVETPGDINEHLVTLRHYAQKCSHITEMGVCRVISTWAFLAARPDKLISYDFMYVPQIERVKMMAQAEGLNFKFEHKDVLDVEIEETDLLFIDTFHHYLQLSRELKKHSPKVGCYIILHDTVSYGMVNEELHPDALAEFYRLGKDPSEFKNHPVQGIMPAINEFLKENECWEVDEHYKHNNGLMILRRIA